MNLLVMLMDSDVPHMILDYRDVWAKWIRDNQSRQSSIGILTKYIEPNSQYTGNLVNAGKKCSNKH